MTDKNVAIMDDKNETSTELMLAVSVLFLVILLQIGVSNLCPHQDSNSSRTRQSFHWKRRVQHILTGLVFYVLSYILPSFLSIFLLLIGTLSIFLLHQWRLRSEQGQTIYLSLFGELLRPKERLDTLPSAFYFLLGVLMTCILFPMRIAQMALLCLTLGDPLAAIIGTLLYWKKLDERNSVGGCLTCFLVCFGIVWSRSEWRTVAIVGATAATLAEAMAWRIGIDDNFLIPFSLGVSVWLCESWLDTAS